MKIPGKFKPILATVLSTVALSTISTPVMSEPSIALKATQDPSANVSDFYMFRSWEDDSKVILILNVNAGQSPGDGPAYFGFNDDVIYRINIDNDTDGIANDIIYEFRFNTEFRPAYGQLSFTQPYVGNPRIVSRPELKGITALDGTGSEGITLRQTYTVTEIRGWHKTKLFTGTNNVVAPSNAGPLTMPDYEMLAAQAIYSDETHDMRIFAGQRAESFYGDTGALYDGAAPRRNPPIATPEEDMDDTTNIYGVNRFEGFNVQSIALEIPIERLTGDSQSANNTGKPYIGGYASASRPKYSARGGFGDSSWLHSHFRRKTTQITRMGNAMVKSLIIDVPYEDSYNASSPKNDEQFASMYFDPSINRPPTSEIFGIPAPPAPRMDLVNMFLKYPIHPSSEFECGYACADLLHLNIKTPPTAPENQQRLGSLIGTDPAGIPNGRRPNDDVLDFTVRVIGGPALIGARLSDGINFADGIPGSGTSDGPGYGSTPGNRLDVTINGIVKEFPFLATPHSGR